MEYSKAVLDQIKLDSQNYPIGILPPGLIGHTVINISDIDLSGAQIEAYKKVSPFVLLQVLLRNL